MTLTPEEAGIVLGVMAVAFFLTLAYFARKDREDSGCNYHHFGSRRSTGDFDLDVRERGVSRVVDEVKFELSLFEETEQSCKHEGCGYTKEGRRYVDTETVRFDL